MQILEHVLDPRWRFVYSHFHTAILCFFQTFIFQRKPPNLLTKLLEVFYHSYFGSFCRYRKAMYFWSLGISLYLELVCFLFLFLLYYVMCALVLSEGTVILINKCLILPDLAVNEQTIQAHVLCNRFYLDTTDASTDVNMSQPRQLTCLWNNNGVLEYRKQCYL